MQWLKFDFFLIVFLRNYACLCSYEHTGVKTPHSAPLLSHCCYVPESHFYSPVRGFILYPLIFSSSFFTISTDSFTFFLLWLPACIRRSSPPRFLVSSAALFLTFPSVRTPYTEIYMLSVTRPDRGNVYSLAVAKQFIYLPTWLDPFLWKAYCLLKCLLRAKPGSCFCVGVNMPFPPHQCHVKVLGRPQVRLKNTEGFRDFFFPSLPVQLELTRTAARVWSTLNLSTYKIGLHWFDLCIHRIKKFEVTQAVCFHIVVRRFYILHCNNCIHLMETKAVFSLWDLRLVTPEAAEDVQGVGLLRWTCIARL